VFYIIATAAPILTVSFSGFLGGGVAGETVPNYLANVVANESQVLIGLLVELIWTLAVVGIIVTLFPILRRENETLALGFSSLRIMEAISTMIHGILLLSLLTLSQEFVAARLPQSSHFQTAGSLILAAREWAFLIGSGLIWSLSALILNVLLYQSRLIPRWLSIWGLLGAALSLSTYLLQLFSIELTALMFLPIALQEMVFAVWLIVKGFNTSEVVS
jgi:hypothetical protein